MDPNALEGDDTPLEHRRSLPERVIRRHQPGAGNARPAWVEAHASNGAGAAHVLPHHARPQAYPAAHRPDNS
jgi:hypothetical protein